MHNFRTKKNRQSDAGSPCYDIILLSQLLTIGLYYMFVPIIRILLVSVQSSTVLVLFSVHIHKSVSLLISVEPAEKICVRPCAVCQDTAAIITRFLELLYVMFQVILGLREYFERWKHNYDAQRRKNCHYRAVRDPCR